MPSTRRTRATPLRLRHLPCPYCRRRRARSRASRSRASRRMSRSPQSSRRGSHDRRAEEAAPAHLDRMAAHRGDRGHLHRLHAAVTFTPKWKFDAVLAAIVAAWFFGGRAIFKGPDLDVFLVQASAILSDQCASTTRCCTVPAFLCRLPAPARPKGVTSEPLPGPPNMMCCR